MWATVVALTVLAAACTQEPSTLAPSTLAPSTLAPSTLAPSTLAPSTLAPSTLAPSTLAPPPAFELEPATDPIGAVTHGTLVFGGRERTYRLYVPSQLPSGLVPLFIGLHGGTGWGDQFARTNHVEGLAESNGFIVVHPDGVQISGGRGAVWNGGICCGVAARENIDDVGFIDALIDALLGEHDIDPHRVVAFGHSNGAIMSYRLACELAERIVGIGVYAGTLGVATCSPALAVSVLHVHGAADTNIPIAGGVGPDAISGVDFPAPHDGFDTLARADGCAPASTTVVGDITTEVIEPCVGGTAAAFVTIAMATHAWPAGTPMAVPASGPGYAGYDATAAIVSFLLSHPRQ